MEDVFPSKSPGFVHPPEFLLMVTDDMQRTTSAAARKLRSPITFKYQIYQTRMPSNPIYCNLYRHFSKYCKPESSTVDREDFALTLLYYGLESFSAGVYATPPAMQDRRSFNLSLI
jgi:hypothetical protein